MSSHAASQDYLARIAGEIMFSEKYMDLLDHIYSTRDTIVEFELNPKHFLMRHGIHIPEDMDVIIHEPGTLGKRARVDFHWGESVQTAHSNILAARRRCRELARVACDTLHSREMEKLIQAVEASPEALQECASNPKRYAAAHSVTVPDELDFIVDPRDPNGTRIELRFGAPSGISEAKMRIIGGYYCCDGVCCCFY